MQLVPRHRASDADDAAFLASQYGLTPDPWQYTVLEAWLALRPDGKWAASRCGLAVPRQNGKNGVIEMRELFGMVTLGEKFLHTAHEVKTARKAFARLRSFFENERRYPELAAMVTDVRQTNGQEAIILANGGSCEFVARSKGSGRGFTVDCIVMDEAQDLNDDHIEALLPTISAAPKANPQQIFTGTPPGPSVSGEIFTRLRQDGLSGKDKRLAWHEWSCPVDVDLDHPQSLAMANPALGIRLHREVAEAERGTLSDAGYGRERLGIWDPPAADGGDLDIDQWSTLADPTAQRGASVVFGADVDGDRLAHIAVAWRRPDELVQVMLADTGLSPLEAPDRLSELAGKWRGPVMIGGPAVVFESDVRDAHVVTSSEFAAACGRFDDLLREDGLRHGNQPELNAAVQAAKWRKFGTSGERSLLLAGAPLVGPLAAAVRAVHGLMNGRGVPPATPAGAGAQPVAGSSETADLAGMQF